MHFLRHHTALLSLDFVEFIHDRWTCCATVLNKSNAAINVCEAGLMFEEYNWTPFLPKSRLFLPGYVKFNKRGASKIRQGFKGISRGATQRKILLKLKGKKRLELLLVSLFVFLISELTGWLKEDGPQGHQPSKLISSRHPFDTLDKFRNSCTLKNGAKTLKK